MNYEAILKRAEKVIKKHESREQEATVYVSEDGMFPDNFNGLVVILDKDTGNPA